MNGRVSCQGDIFGLRVLFVDFVRARSSLDVITCLLVYMNRYDVGRSSIA